MARKRKVSKKHLTKYWKRFLIFQGILLFLIISLFVILVLADPKLSVFPLIHNYQPSPKEYVAKKEVSSISLPKPEVVEHGSRDSKKIALTFDADMTPGMVLMLDKKLVSSWYNKDAIEFLKKEKTKATIFFTGLWVMTYPKEAKEIADNPLFEAGNHSYDHPAFTKFCFGLPFINKTDEDEVELAQKEIAKITGKVPLYFRFPGGCYNKINVETISRLGLTIVHWDVIGGDGFNNNENSIISNVLSRTQNGSIIVLHLNAGPYAPKTHLALYKIVPELKKRGFEFVTLSELLGK